MNKLSDLARTVSVLLKQQNHTIAVAESSTAGLVSACLLAIPGASAYFIGGSIIYTRVAQKALLRVPDEIMTDVRASTENYALLNARAVRQSHNTTWGLAETGATGPTGNRYGDLAGHVCIGIAGPVERSITIETGSSDRESNMWAFTRAALDLLEECIGGTT